MQLKALPGQPVCKHSVSMCFGRAPAPRAHSKLQQGRRGRPAAAPGSAAPTEVGGWVGAAGPPHHAPLQPRMGAGGGGQAGCSFPLSSILSPILVATHGFSWLLGGPSGGRPGGEAREAPQAAWLGVSPAGASVLPPSSWAAAGQPQPRVYFGLSAWSFWVSSAGSSPCEADLSSTKKRGRRWLC